MLRKTNNIYSRWSLWKEKRPFVAFLVIYFLAYLVIFSIITLAFVKQGKMFLGLGDGPGQTYPAFYYYSTWLKELFSNIFHGVFEFPLWSWNIGLGGDVLTTFHYYVIGDPFAFLALFWPQDQIEFLIYFVIYAKIFCMGITFWAYCNYMKLGWYESLIGSLLFAFSGYSIVTLIPVQIFSNAVILLPLLFLGLEKIMRKEKPHVFVLALFFCVITNFYMLYMLALLIFIYGIIRYFFKYRKGVLDFLATFSKAIVFFLTGILMGFSFLLPMINASLNSSRWGALSLSDLDLLYNKGFYKMFMLEFATPPSGDGYTNLSFIAISLFAIILLFIIRNKKYWQLRFSFILLTVIMLLPIGGWLFNGFSYPVNRWMFGYVFLISIITVIMLPQLYHMSKKQGLLLGGFLCVYFLLCLYYAGNTNIYPFIGLFAAALLLSLLFVFRSRTKQQYIKIAILAFVSISLGLNGFLLYSGKYMNMVAGYNDIGEIKENYAKNITNTAANIEDDSFYRTKVNWEVNASVVNKFHSDQSYWTVQNGSEFDLYRDQNTPLHFTHLYPGYGNDPYLNALVGIKYQVLQEHEESALYGMEEIATSPEFVGRAYQNRNYLPLGFTYEKTMSRQEYNQYSVMDKKELLLDYLVLGDIAEQDESVDTVQTKTEKTQKTAYTIVENENLETNRNQVTIKDASTPFTIQVDVPANHALYFQFKNLHCDSTQWVHVNAGNLAESFHYLNPGYLYYYNNHDYLVCMGTSSEGIKEINFSFQNGGSFSYDDLSVYTVNMDTFENLVEERSKDQFENLTMGSNNVTGEISVDKDKMLFFSIPYSEGWTAKVNGEVVDIQKANIAFMAIPLSSGNNHIELYYHTPGLVSGIIISTVTFVVYFSVFFILWKRKQKKQMMKSE